MSQCRPRVLMLSVRADHGGGPEHLLQLTRALGRDCDVFIACPRELPYWPRFEAAVGSGRMLELPHRALTVAAVAAVIRLIRDQRIGIVHGHGRGAGIYARLAALITGRACMHTYHGLFYRDYPQPKRLIALTIEALLGRLTAATIAVSAGEAELARGWRLTAPSALVTIPNGVVIPPPPGGQRPSAPYPVVMMTRFNHQKRTDFIFPIMEELRRLGRLDDFRFVVLGDGGERPALLSRCRDQGWDRWLRMPGAVDDPAPHLDAAFAYLSTSRVEGLPLSLLEALAHGVPVVATDVVGNRDILAQGPVGFGYGLDDCAAAAGHLVALADDPELWRRTSESARAVAETTYSVGRMAAEVLTLYRRLARMD